MALPERQELEKVGTSTRSIHLSTREHLSKITMRIKWWSSVSHGHPDLRDIRTSMYIADKIVWNTRLQEQILDSFSWLRSNSLHGCNEQLRDRGATRHCPQGGNQGWFSSHRTSSILTEFIRTPY